eukprot:4802736-Prymnesium_polylepis.1
MKAFSTALVSGAMAQLKRSSDWPATRLATRAWNPSVQPSSAARWRNSRNSASAATRSVTRA